MIRSKEGYQPQSEMLINILKTNNRLNDVGYGSIYSYLNSSCSFVKWKHEQYDKPRNEDLMLNVKSSTSFKGSKYNNEYQCYEGLLPALLTPKTYLDSTSNIVCYSVLEYDELMDSSDIGPKGKLFSLFSLFNHFPNISIDWIKIATDLELNYDNFDAFVILHGTGAFI